MKKPRRKLAKVVPVTMEEQNLLDPTPKSIRVQAISEFSLDGCTIEMAIDRINNQASSLHEQGFSNLTFELEYYGYDGGNFLTIKADRLEDAREIKARLTAAEWTIRRQREAAIGTEKKERDLLKKLKKKYPDG